MIKFPYILVGGTGCYSCKILYFDIATIIIQVVLLTSLIFRKMLSGRTNKFYALLLMHMLVKIKAVAQRISAIVTRSIQLDQLELKLASCVCILKCPQDMDNYEGMLSFGNSFHTYMPSDGTVNDRIEDKDRRMFQLRNELDNIISNAIAQKRFQMYYQSIYSVQEKKFLYAEALIRLKDKKYGFISQELFITASEKNGTILQIGDFVLDEVCSFLARCEKNRCQYGTGYRRREYTESLEAGSLFFAG